MTVAIGNLARLRPAQASHAPLAPAAVAGWIDALAVEAGTPLSCDNSGHEVAITAPGLELRCDRLHASWHATATTVTVILGRPRLDGARADAEQVGRLLATEREPWTRLGGHHALIHVDVPAGEIVLATDRFGIFPLAWHREGTRIGFSDRADCVPGVDGIDPQALFDYVYFHMIPAPRTVYRGVHRVEPATALRISALAVEVRPTWKPEFAPPTTERPTHEEFRAVVRRAVLDDADGALPGCFLSGGTDSSTVAGMLAQERGRVQTYSIGFDADGYDEMAYARIAARHFGTEHHEYYVTPDDIVRAVPRLAEHYDQPFGNSSALPAYVCAQMAGGDGVRTLLAGDGGDELFGGNVRYAKQKLFEAYGRVPSTVRSAVEPLLLNSAAGGIPGVAKLSSYVAQARIPMPARTETYNLLSRFGVDAVFTPRFLAQVDTGAPPALQADVYSRSDGADLVNRMLAYDWRFTLADNDLPKVVGTTRLAGLAVRFPLLDDGVVDLSLRLSANDKVRRLRLRHFFKEALTGFLPTEIIAKKKHGFGLPVGPWLVANPAFRAFAFDAVRSLAARGVIRGALVDDLFSRRLEQHPGYYGEMVWILMMLEHWLRSRTTGWSAH